MNLYPLMVNLEDRPVIVAGGGSVASRKVADLIHAGAMVRVIAPDISDKIRGFAVDFALSIDLLEREYRPGDLDGAFLVFCASDDPAVNRQVSRDAQALNILVNCADDPGISSFHVPSFMRRGELILALATGGASPAMAARLRRDLEKHIPYNIEDILMALRKIRDLLKSDNEFAGKGHAGRGDILKKIVNDDYILGRLSGCRDNEKKLRTILAELK